jgi:hypothetical protein
MTDHFTKVREGDTIIITLKTQVTSINDEIVETLYGSRFNRLDNEISSVVVIRALINPGDIVEFTPIGSDTSLQGIVQATANERAWVVWYGGSEGLYDKNQLKVVR